VKSLFHTKTPTTNFRKPHRDRDVWGGSFGLATGVDDVVDLLEHDNGAVGSAAAAIGISVGAAARVAEDFIEGYLTTEQPRMTSSRHHRSP